MTRDTATGSRRLCVLLSILFPGAGQAASGRWLAAAAWATVALLVFLSLVFTLYSSRFVTLRPFFAVLAAGGVLWIVMLADAVRSGRRMMVGVACRRSMLTACGLAVVLCPVSIWLAWTSLPHVFRTIVVRSSAMSPVLMGERIDAADTAAPPTGMARALRLLLQGETVLTVRALVDGAVAEEHQALPDRYVFYIQQQKHEIPLDLTVHFAPGEQVAAGQILASGLRRAGDVVLLDGVSLRARPPQRGELVSLRAGAVSDPRLHWGTRLVRRVAGLPGERISLRGSSVCVNGEPLHAPEIFVRIASGVDPYSGYKPANPLHGPKLFLAAETDEVALGEDEYLLLADQGSEGLDGRHFGPVPAEAIEGRVVRILWPLARARVPD